MMLAQACMPTAQSGRTIASAEQQPAPVQPAPPVINPVEAPPKVEIRNLVEPKITVADNASYNTGTGIVGSGTYVRKLTLPQNYSGFLYLGGLNINSLKNRYTSVRFTFGVSGVQKTVPAVVSRAPGITPNTDIDVLVMDLKNRPFNDINLIYDLYDYKDYSLDPNPVENNRDPNLYCRALRLQDDSTFNGQGLCDGYAADGVSPLLDENGNQVAEKCLYSYAKVLDRGLARGAGASFSEVFPKIQQTDYTDNDLGYYAQTTSNLLNRCLPDKSLDDPTVVVSGVSGLTRVDDLSFTFFNEDRNLVLRNSATAIIENTPVKYLGPFKPINTANWELSRDAAFGEFGLFDFTPGIWPAGTFPVQMDSMHLHRSKLFPRFTKMRLGRDVSYLETDITNLDSKTPVKMPADGVSGLMDGCSARVTSTSYNGYNVGSCNASGKIEILARDDNGVEVVVAETNQVVLQLVRAVTMTQQETQVDYLYTNFKQCQNSNQCGSDECCYNKRCWNNALVATCPEQYPSQPNLGIGAACNNDLECTSMCCNGSTGTCSVNNLNLPTPVLCNKQPNQFCVADEWCSQTTVYDCYLIDDGLDDDGVTPLCHKQCFPRKAFGKCVNNKCGAPPQGIGNTLPNNPTGAQCANAGPIPDFSSSNSSN